MKTQATNNKQQGNNNSIDAREELLEEVMEIFRGLQKKRPPMSKTLTVRRKPSAGS